MPAKMFNSLRRHSSIFKRRDEAADSKTSLSPNSKSPSTITVNPTVLFPPNRNDHSTTPSPSSVTPPPSDVDSSESAQSSRPAGVRPRPQSVRPASQAQRHSVYSQNARSASTPRFQDPLSPRIINFGDGGFCSQKVLLLNGRIGEPGERRRQGYVQVINESAGFASQRWQVEDSRFKVLVSLVPGDNRLRFEFVPRTSQISIHSQPHPTQTHRTNFRVYNVPATQSPPLHLVILVARDSTETFDSPPNKVQREGNTLDVAVKKMRMAGLLWQAFVAEQMRRHMDHNRAFRLEEEWTMGTVAPPYAMTNEIKVHVIRLDETMDQIRALDIAQQHEPAQNKHKLHEIATSACRKYFNPSPGCNQHVAAMFLDSHWDPSTKVIHGHAALGNGSGDIRVGIFGSHALHAYPTNLEDVVSCFQDSNKTDLAYVANDAGRSGTSWEAANIGLSAHLHEVGHVFDLPHREVGIMCADYHLFNRSFCVWENYRTATGERGQAITEYDQEGFFHRLDILKMRNHPCFRRPNDRLIPEDSVQIWPLNDEICIAAGSGVMWIEYYDVDKDVDGQDNHCRYWTEHWQMMPDGRMKGQDDLKLSRNTMKNDMPVELRNAKRLRLEIYSVGQARATIADFDKFLSDGQLKIGKSKIRAYRGKRLGHGVLNGAAPQDLVLDSFHIQTKLLTHVIVYHGDAVDGLEFCYEDGTSQLTGKKTGKPGGTTFPLHTRSGEQIHGFIIRAGWWIDAIQILTTNSRRSEIFGNANGGSAHLMAPPQGYQFAGISASYGALMDSFQLIVSR